MSKASAAEQERSETEHRQANQAQAAHPAAEHSGNGQQQRPQAQQKSTDQLWQLAKQQSEARRQLAKQQAEGRRSLKSHDKDNADNTNVPAEAQSRAKEEAEWKKLRDQQTKERQEADPNHVMPTFAGYENQEAVTRLHAELMAIAPEHRFEVGELRNWDTEFDIFDPVTGIIMSPARAHRRDVGDLGILMTCEAVVSDIETARRHQATHGVANYSSDRVMTT